jgi:predicted phage-related endonuclease
MSSSVAPLSPTRGYLGGGNIAAILGISPFSSPLEAYLQITNTETREITKEKQDFFDNRKALEPWAEERFTHKTGLRITARNVRYTDAEFDFMRAEIDFEADGCNGETKTVEPRAYAHWGRPQDDEEAPAYVVAQAMWGMGVHPVEMCYVNALIGFDDHRVYQVHRNDELIAKIRRTACSFWKHNVLARRQPAPTTIEDLKFLYGRGTTRVQEIDKEHLPVLQRLIGIKSEMAALANEKELAELKIKTHMKDATSLTLRGIEKASWKPRTDGVRVFRIR